MDVAQDRIESDLINITQTMLDESGTTHLQHTVTMENYLDRDLGIDSISKVELITRIDEHFNIQLPESIIGEADTLKEIMNAIQSGVATPVIKQVTKAPILEATTVDPASCNTLIEILLQYAEVSPDRPHIYLQDETGTETVITYGNLYAQAKKVARGLTELGISGGETVAIMLPTSEQFFYSFFGALLAGGVPVPIYPPFRPDKIGEYAVREAGILSNAQVRYLITFAKAEKLSQLLKVFIPSLKSVVTTKELMALPGQAIKFAHERDSAALIQYTSGSTAAPKGVLLSHHNLLSNIYAYGHAINITSKDVCISWLPLYHDMGLIGTWLGSFYYGIPVTIMSPMTFLMHPAKWLWAIHYHGGTISASPNFGYELCVRKIKDSEIEGLDLSRWRFAGNGAEAVNPETIRRFTKRFASYGFKKKNLYPVYGLAESSVGLSVPPLKRGARFDLVDKETLETENKAMPASKHKKQLEFTGCGIPIKGHEVRVVDSDNQVLAERCVGHLQFRGPSTMQGYYRNNEATANAFHDGWCDTGDLAYLLDNEIFITGRKKDIIIKAGRNYYPEEVEQATAEVEGIRKGCVVAFGVQDIVTSTEQLIIVAETHEKSADIKKKIERDVIDKVTTALGVPPDQVILVKPRTIPKTSSGKLRRASTKQNFQKGKLGKSVTPVWLQLTKLFAQGAVRKFKEFLQVTGKFVYSLYVGLCLLLLLVPILLSIHIPKQTTARKAAKFWSRLGSYLAFCPIKLKGKQYLESPGTHVFTSNHASYIDALILLAILPTNTLLVGKLELGNAPILRSLIKKLGHLLVERIDVTKSIQDAERVQSILNSGESITIFPEGTFTYASGLRPFKTGAFKMATVASSNVIPIALKGTRHILRANSWLFSPRKIEVTVSEPIAPIGQEWQDIMWLKNSTREVIAKHCGEEKINA